MRIPPALKSPIVHLAALVAAFGIAFGAEAQFDGNPTAPQNFEDHPDFANYDVQVHSRDVSTWDTLESMAAQHGPDCSGPPASHENHTYEGSVYVCKDHLMTAINAGGYGVIYLTPNQLLDWSNGPATIDFEMSTERMSKRDWPDIWITPWHENLALPFNDGDVDLQTPPRNGLHIETNNSEGAPVLQTFTNGSTWQNQPGWAATVLQHGITAGTNQAATRQHFRVRVERIVVNGQPFLDVQFERLASTTATYVRYIWEWIPVPAYTSGVVQFGHHSYNPTKDGAGVPATWHWDAIEITGPTFRIIKAQQRYTTGGVVHFDAPAPANSWLRFAAIGTVHINGSQVKPQVPTLHNEHFNSYFVPVAEGTTSVTIGLSTDNWYQGPFRAKDLAFFSLNTGGEPSTPAFTPTATSAAMPTATGTPIPATATSTTTPTEIPPTSTPTSTPAPPSATPIPSGTCETWIKQADGQYILLSGQIEKWQRLPDGSYLPGPESVSKGLC